jgi:hypothetical protein
MPESCKFKLFKISTSLVMHATDEVLKTNLIVQKDLTIDFEELAKPYQ